MRHFFLSRVSIACILMCMALVTHAEKRVALIIGNSSYSANNLGFKELPACVNDANVISNKLKSLNPSFQTLVVTNANKDEINNAISQFSTMCKDADVALFYYSGHACRIDDDLYIIPSNTHLNSDILSDQLVRVKNIDNTMQRNSKLSLMFFDACRDTPPTNTPITTKGAISSPTQIGSNYSKNSSSRAPRGWANFYATQDGKKADSGDGSTLSPFTKVLASHLTDGDEFREVWLHSIRKEVPIYAKDMTPSENIVYTGDFYFNRGGKKFSDQISNTNTTISEKKTITIHCSVPSAKLDIYGKEYSLNQPISFKRGESYVFTVDAPGYEKYSDKIDVDKSTDVININLKKVEQARLIVSSNKNASVYIDSKYVGEVHKGDPLSLQSTSGTHSIKLTANNCYPYETEINLSPGNNRKYFTIERRIPHYWDWDNYDGAHYFSYHFSPQYQIGFNYLYRPEESDFSYGLFLSSSIGLFKGIGGIEPYSYAYASTDVTYTIEVNGEIVKYRETSSLVSDTPIDKYSEEIDPNHEAKKYDSNALILANFGYNPCNGLLIEAGVGAGFHQDKYYLPYTSYMTKTTTTNEITGELVGEPKYEYIKGGGSKWFRQNSKWSPALRLGAKALIPLDGWDKYFLTIGGGYTFQFMNNKYSSWDATIGIAWTF